MAGAVAGCSETKPPAPVTPAPTTGAGTVADGGTRGGDETTDAAGGGADPANFLTGEKHACRGLNMCKNLDKDGDNACAGQGDCATIAAHSCHAQNECKGQGGCGETAGQNACKGQGECAVPLHAGAWEKARAVFEAKAKEMGKEAGAAPEAG
jgi:hypothetical protein